MLFAVMKTGNAFLYQSTPTLNSKAFNQHFYLWIEYD